MTEKKAKKTVKPTPKKTIITKEEQVMDGLNMPFDKVMALLTKPKIKNKNDSD